MNFLVSDRMTAPVHTVRPETKGLAMMKILQQRHVSAVPVLDGDGRLLGIVSTTDVVRSLAVRGDLVAAAGDLMSAPVIVAAPTERIDDAAWRLASAGVHRLVVTIHDRVMGILSAGDILARGPQPRSSAPIRDIMKTTIHSVDADDSIEHAIELLASAGVHGLVVMEGSTPVGIFAHAEAMAARRLGPSLRLGAVERVMSAETICLDAATPIDRAAACAVHMDVRRILVTEKKRLAGILGSLDLVQAVARAGGMDPFRSG